jgi:hypothetical protein
MEQKNNEGKSEEQHTVQPMNQSTMADASVPAGSSGPVPSQTQTHTQAKHTT